MRTTIEMSLTIDAFVPRFNAVVHVEMTAATTTADDVVRVVLQAAQIQHDASELVERVSKTPAIKRTTQETSEVLTSICLDWRTQPLDVDIAKEKLTKLKVEFGVEDATTVDDDQQDKACLWWAKKSLPHETKLQDKFGKKATKIKVTVAGKDGEFATRPFEQDLTLQPWYKRLVELRALSDERNVHVPPADTSSINDPNKRVRLSDKVERFPASALLPLPHLLTHKQLAMLDADASILQSLQSNSLLTTALSSVLAGDAHDIDTLCGALESLQDSNVQVREFCHRLLTVVGAYD